MGTISTEIMYKHYVVGFHGETIFAYNFLVLDAAHWEMYVNDILRTDYTVTGVGNPQGGTIIFLASAQLITGNVIFFRRHTPMTQLMDLVDHAAFLADSLETAFNKLTLIDQELREELSRRVALRVPTREALRNLFLPAPRPLGIWGWNADASQVIYYDFPVPVLLPALTPHLAFGEIEVVVPTVDGAVQLTSPTIFPAGSLAFAAMVRVHTTFGNSNGLTTFSAGSPEMLDRWGAGLSRIGTLNSAANEPNLWRNYAVRPMAQNEPLVLTAETGTFDGTGEARVVSTYLYYSADPLVPGLPALAPHMAVAELDITVPTVDGALQLTSPTIFPAGSLALGAVIRVTTPFGNTKGLTTFSAGTPDLVDRWGGGLSRTGTVLDTANNLGMFRSYNLIPVLNNEPIIFTAEDGLFDGTGLAQVVGTYITFLPV